MKLYHQQRGRERERERSLANPTRAAAPSSKALPLRFRAAGEDLVREHLVALLIHWVEGHASKGHLLLDGLHVGVHAAARGGGWGVGGGGIVWGGFGEGGVRYPSALHPVLWTASGCDSGFLSSAVYRTKRAEQARLLQHSQRTAVQSLQRRSAASTRRPLSPKPRKHSLVLHALGMAL